MNNQTAYKPGLRFVLAPFFNQDGSEHKRERIDVYEIIGSLTANGLYRAKIVESENPALINNTIPFWSEDIIPLDIAKLELL